VRKQLKPVGDEIIDKIAHSDVVQTAIGPIKGPVHKISDAIGKVVSKGVDVVKGVQSKVAAFLNPEKLQEMTGLGPSIKQPTPVAEAAAAPTDFLGAVKDGLHARLMILGNARLVSLAKSGAKFVWGKVKAAGTRIKEAIFGKKVEFQAAGDHHELWIERGTEKFAVMVASNTARALRTRIGRVIEAPEADTIPGALRGRLQALQRRAEELEDAVNAGNLNEQQAVAPCNEIRDELQRLGTEFPQHMGPILGVPRGFTGEQQVTRFAQIIQNNLDPLLAPGHYEAWVQGSSVVGRSWDKGIPFGEHSDIDLAIMSKQLVDAYATEQGAELRDGGIRTPENPWPAVTGPMLAQLSQELGGRVVNTMFFRTQRAMLSRGDSIQIHPRYAP
jgi:hypothetical protein